MSADEKVNVGGAQIGPCKGCYSECQLDAQGYCDECDPPKDFVESVGSHIKQAVDDFLDGRRARKEREKK